MLPVVLNLYGAAILQSVVPLVNHREPTSANFCLTSQEW